MLASVQTEDTVWARCRATGIDPASGKPVAIDVVQICRFISRKLVEHWGVSDRLALLHQIGALPKVDLSCHRQVFREREEAGPHDGGYRGNPVREIRGCSCRRGNTAVPFRTMSHRTIT